MKRCAQCNSESPDSMNFCLQCGAALPQTASNAPSDPPPTQVYREANPTNAGAGRETETFAGNRGNFAAAPPKKSNAKMFLVIGGVLSLFLLLIVAGVGVVAYSVWSASQRTANNRRIANYNPTYPTPPPAVSPVANRSLPPAVKPSATSTKTPTTTKTNTTGEPSGKFERTWIDYNVTENGRTGMRIHNKFSTYNLKDIQCYLAVYVQNEDGTNLTSDDVNFKSQQGQLAVFRLLEPNYDNTIYDDIELFLPYGEINVAPGKHKLKLDVDLITKDGNLIQHFNLHDFEYEKFAE